MSEKTALDYYLEGVRIRQDPTKFNADGILELRRKLEKAIETDKKFSLAYAELAYTYVRFYQQGWTREEWPTDLLEKAEELAKDARHLKDDFDSRWSLAIVYWNQGKFVQSFNDYEEAAQRWDDGKFYEDIEEYVALRAKDPRNPDLIADMAEARTYAGEPNVAIQQLNEAIDIRGKMDDQFSANPYWYWWNLARAYYMAKRYREAIAAAGEITNPPNDVLLITAASKAQLGDLDAARAEMVRFSQNDSEWSIAKAKERHFERDGDLEHWLDGLRKAELKGQ